LNRRCGEGRRLRRLNGFAYRWRLGDNIWNLVCRNRWRLAFSRTGQSPFSLCVLRPNYTWIDERDFLDHQPPGKEREETNPQTKCSRLEEITRACRGSLRNRDAAQFESAPWRHAHTANFQRGAESSSQFLPNLRLCALRLHIQVHADQDNRAERNHDP
jgi:hypothetical protein